MLRAASAANEARAAGNGKLELLEAFEVARRQFQANADAEESAGTSYANPIASRVGSVEAKMAALDDRVSNGFGKLSSELQLVMEQLKGMSDVMVEQAKRNASHKERRVGRHKAQGPSEPTKSLPPPTTLASGSRTPASGRSPSRHRDDEPTDVEAADCVGGCCDSAQPALHDHARGSSRGGVRGSPGGREHSRSMRRMHSHTPNAAAPNAAAPGQLDA